MGPHRATVIPRLEANGHRHFLIILIATAYLLLSASFTSAQNQQPVFSGQTDLVERRILTVGVLTTEGVTRAIEAWRPTVDLLNREADIVEMPVRFVLKPHTLPSLRRAVESGELDFILSNPAFFVSAEVEHGARAVLSRARMWDDRTYGEIGSVIFTNQDSPYRSLSQLRGRRVMAVGQDDFSGWWLAEQEFRRRRLEPDRTFSELIFADGNEREVVYAVQTGLVDAGVVRAGVLESLHRGGVIDIDDFAPMEPILHQGYPFMSSTELYPEWLLSAMPNIDETTLAHVINVLLNVEPDSAESLAAAGAVWQAPRNYQKVHDLLISLRVRPYENYLMQAAGRIYQNYRFYILAFVSAILASLVFLVFQLRRNMLMVEINKNVLQSEMRSKVFYRSAVEEHTVFLMMDTRGRITHANSNFCDTTERLAEDLIGTQLMDILPEHEQMILQNDVMSSMRAGQPWDGPMKVYKDDGSIAWAQCTIIPVSGAEEELSEIAVVATDMTQTRKGISEATFNDSLELIEDQVIVFRPENYDLLYCNKAADEMFVGRRANIDTWRERKVSHFITDDDMRSLKMRCQALQEGPQRRMTWEVTAQNGTPYEISLEYVEPENDEPRFISMYRDITARKVAEKAKNDFVATVSHELRTPLTSMKGALGLALSGAIGEMPEQMNKMVSMASNNCDKLVTLINDMLDIEKMTEGSMEFALEQVDLAEVVEEVVEANKMKGEKRSVNVRYNLVEDEEGMFTLGERTRLVQMLEHVVDNAVKFSDDASEVIVSLLVHRGRLRVSVRDFGCGIPTAARSTIFDKFTQADMGDTRAAGGTGLGLAVAKAITEGHNGRIFFASEEGTGSEFFIDLPRLIGEEVVSLEEANKAAEEAEAIARSEGAADGEKRSAQSTVAINYDSMEVTHFSQVGMNAEQIEEEGEVFEGQSSIQNLLVQLRSGGFDVDIESGSVSVAQIVSGKGVVGQSTVFNWLSDQGRNLIAGLTERNQLANIPVSVIQAKAVDENLTDALMLNGVRANLYTNWLSTLPELSDKEDLKFDLMAVASSDLPILDAEEINMSSVTDVQQALALAGMEKFDAVLHFDTLGLANCMTVIPVVGGKLPASVPVVLVVSQTEAPEAERGVVSKFTRSNPAGRGKSRRRSRG